MGRRRKEKKEFCYMFESTDFGSLNVSLHSTKHKVGYKKIFWSDV